MALIPNAWKNTKNDLREKIDSLTKYGTDNLSWKKFSDEKEKEPALVIIDNIQKVEEILKKVGTFQNVVTKMWNAGIGWTIRLSTLKRKKINVEVTYSDSRFKIRALTGDILNQDGYSRFISDHEEAFTIAKYTHWVRLEDLEDILTRFKNLF